MLPVALQVAVAVVQPDIMVPAEAVVWAEQEEW